MLFFTEPLSSPSQNILYSPQVLLLRKTLIPPNKGVSSSAVAQINIFFVIYFYLKEFVSLSQKFDSHTANSKVHSYTDGGEFSGYSQCPKGIKEGKGTQNTSKRWERHHMPFLSLLIISCRRLLGGSNTI